MTRPNAPADERVDELVGWYATTRGMLRVKCGYTSAELDAMGDHDLMKTYEEVVGYENTVNET